jgi:hypothetical protein
MNWLQRTVCAQQAMETILTAVATGGMDANTALIQLQQINAPAPECCNVIMAMYNTYPQGQRALDDLGRGLHCNDVLQMMNPPAPDFAPPEVEQPMQVPSVDIE